MRITIEIDDDVMAAAKVLAVDRGMSVGEVISESVRRGLAARTRIGERDGFPVFELPDGREGFGLTDVLRANEKSARQVSRCFLKAGN